ncbi:hypothetical protein [Methylovirgula sp. HY1]|uniref:hypothetical protein n=1 Tax=Methylovirgula sp. HY1 TaxID=2822761 RepID=UPI001C785C89|nr:hypothetical protein [Methylovirgula sp. HY1]QXX74498.1 hypothetical protein MHY1_01311 [Methylovirgula sp. HY1]
MSALSNQLIENKALMFGAAAIAFFVAAVLILLVFRLAFGRRLRMPGGRARQMRLGIVDAFDLDRQRQLVLVRRDNVEHLIMIGGPTDFLIESQILRTEARSRDKEARERDQNYTPGTPVKSPTAEPKLAIPPLAPETQPATAPEPIAAAAHAPLPGLAPIGPASRSPTGAPAPTPRRPLSPPVAPVQKPLPMPPAPYEPAAETDQPGAPPTPKPTTKPSPLTQPGEPPAFMRWPARTPTPSTPPLRTTPKPQAAHPEPQPVAAALPEQPVAGPPVPSLEGLESLEEEMAKLLGRGPTKP